MNAEQITTIITNVLTGSGVILFLWMWIRGLRKQLAIQKDTLEAVKTQVSETEKIGNIYRKLFDELPTEVEKWKNAILKLKDERIAELEKATQNKDDQQTNTVKLEFDKMIEAMNALELRVSTVNQLAPVSAPVDSGWAYKGSKLEALLNNERTILSVMSDHAKVDKQIALDIWSLLYGEPNSLTAKTIASKINLEQPLVRHILEEL